MRGSQDSQYTEVRGIITEVERNRVTLLTESGKIKVEVHNTDEPALSSCSTGWSTNSRLPAGKMGQPSSPSADRRDHNPEPGDPD